MFRRLLNLLVRLDVSRNEYQISDSADYFLNSLKRISQSDFVPTLVRERIRKPKVHSKMQYYL